MLATETAGDKVMPLLQKLIPPLRLALTSKENKTF